MHFYHVTKKENVQRILENGLYPSKSGLDGPGVYMWKGPLSRAVSEADLSLSDNHCEMTELECSEFKQQLAVIAITMPSHSVFSAEWPEYVVYRDHIPSNCITYCGSFYELTERCNRHPLRPLSEQIHSASVRAVEAYSTDKRHERAQDPER